ncbi:class I SAM-dependent methyltransferase [Gulosibacter bifidus]|uniref:Class I SAM-dependent methyltransferase n=1 Tax=Gulosibacter bifidus TaxID=272239 RepID=A0ABW5RM97_9MICO|nr:methyltransferase [Gulosibacter bifidus]
MSDQSDHAHPEPVIDVILREIADTDAPISRAAVVDAADGHLTSAMATLASESPRTTCDTGFDTNMTGIVVDLPELVTPATSLVVGYLPKSLAELDEIAATVAAGAASDCILMLGGREKHLVRAMNDVLGRYFESVRASRGARKSRVLVASAPRQGSSVPYPVANTHPELGLTVCAHGGTFAANTLDIGTRALLETLGALPGGRLQHPDLPRAPECAVDLGCGSGILAAVLAQSYPDADVIATDRSWSACASATATANANGLTNLRVLRADAGRGIDRDSVDLVLCNPPFHEGRDVDNGMSNAMFAAAGRMLRPGGICITVFNSHLRHRKYLEHYIGETTQLARNDKFTVTLSRR